MTRAQPGRRFLAHATSLLMGMALVSACAGTPGTATTTTAAGPPQTAGPTALSEEPVIVDGAYAWRTVPVGAGGFVTGIVASSDSTPTIYARTDVGGAYRWLPDTAHWQQLLSASSLPEAKAGDPLSVDSIAAAPSNGKRVYLALGNDGNPGESDDLVQGGRILASDDGGTTWRTSARRWFISGNQRFRVGSERLAVDPDDPDHVLFGSSREGLWQSFDAGDTWSRIAPEQVPLGQTDDRTVDQVGISTVAFVAGAMIAGVAGVGVFTSSDAGDTWQQVRELQTDQYPVGAVEAAGRLWLAIDRWEGSGSFVAVYDLAGDAWTELESPSTSNFTAFAVDPTDPLHVVVADEAVRDGHFWSSRDGGDNWSAHDIVVRSPEIPWLEYSDLDQYMSTGRLMFDPSGSTLWFAEGMAVWQTTDPDAPEVTWVSAARGIEETVTSAILAPPGGAPIGAIADRQGFLFGDVTHYPASTLIDDTFVGGTSLDYSGQHPETVAWVGAEYHIYYSDQRRARGAISTDGGRTWRQFGGTTPAMFGGEVAVSATDPATLVWLPTHFTDPFEYLRAPVGLYVSHDGGQSWEHLDTVGGIDSFHRFLWWFNRRALAADRVNGNFYLMSDEARFFTSVDGAATWTEAAYAPDCIESNACHVLGQLAAQPDAAERLWATVGRGGLYRTDDAGRTAWLKVAGIDEARAIGFGAAMEPGAPLTVFVYGHASGDDQPGLYRSDDDGATWLPISRFPGNSYSEVNSIAGDPDVPGRVYVGFAGTGFTQGDPSAATG